MTASNQQDVKKLQAQIESLEKALAHHEKMSQVDKTLLRIADLSFDDSLDIDSLYRAVCDELNKIINTSNFYIARLSENGEFLSFDYYQDSYGIQFEHEHDFPVRPFGGGLTELVISTGDSMLIDHRQMSRMNADGTITPRRHFAHSWLGAPLVYNKRVIGAMVVQSYVSTLSFTQDDKSVFTFVAHHIAGAIARHEAQRDLLRSATTDSLTGLLNRSAILSRLNDVLSFETRKTNTAVLFIDLDGFKSVNDSLGHECGDTLLRQVARVIQGEVRESDSVGRFGGDEFVIVMDRILEQRDVTQAANRIIAALSRPFSIGDKSVQIGASIGIAFGASTSNSSNALLKQADKAMYHAKKRGKSRYSIAKT